MATEALEREPNFVGSVHLIGSGDSDGKAWANHAMQSLLQPFDYLHGAFYANAACLDTRSTCSPSRTPTPKQVRMGCVHSPAIKTMPSTRAGKDRNSSRRGSCVAPYKLETRRLTHRLRKHRQAGVPAEVACGNAKHKVVF